MVQLPLVRVSYDRIIRHTIGLRPHRPSGFVLRDARLDAKTMIHNYGHGGSGMSLSWGTGAMAADMALAHGERRAAVLGCGAVGLTAARQLQRRGFDVTIYAAYVPPDTTSNYSLAGFTPTSGLVDVPKRTPAWEAQFREAVEIAYRQLQFMAGPKYGISWIQNYSPTESAPAATGTNALLPRAHPGRPDAAAARRASVPDHLRHRAHRDAHRAQHLPRRADARLPRLRRPDRHPPASTTPRDVAALPENLIVNCTGLGAKELFGDEELVPLKGLLVILAPQDEVNYSTNGGVNIPPAQRGLFIHMMPRRDGIVLGGTSERGVSTPDISETERNRIVDNHIRLFQSMTPPASGGPPAAAGAAMSGAARSPRRPPARAWPARWACSASPPPASAPWSAPPSTSSRS